MTEAVNLAFKGILLSPVFILCIFITIAMLKHMIFGGIPTMNQPTEQQREQLQQRDSEIDPNTVWGGTPVTPGVSPPPAETLPIQGAPVVLPSQPNGLQEKTDPYMNRPTIHELAPIYPN